SGRGSYLFRPLKLSEVLLGKISHSVFSLLGQTLFENMSFSFNGYMEGGGMEIKWANSVKCNLAVAMAVPCILMSGTATAVSCGDILYTQEILNEDLTCTVSPAVIIVGPTGGLDMNNYNIECDGTAVGVEMDGAVGYLTGGGTILSCERGVRVAGDGFHNILEVSAISNNFLGIELISDFNFVGYSIATGNGNTGVLVSGERNTLLSNDLGQNSLIGIQVDGDWSNVSQNNVSDNLLWGIYISASNRGSYTQNNVQMNGSVGIYMDASGQMYNNIIGNVAVNNPDFDLRELSVDACDNTNVWLGNTFLTSNPDCLD
ncbi:right-handed parallel beta-helix repeat-containing protein, partial [Microbulbifer sp. OS29]